MESKGKSKIKQLTD